MTESVAVSPLHIDVVDEVRRATGVVGAVTVNEEEDTPAQLVTVTE